MDKALARGLAQDHEGQHDFLFSEAPELECVALTRDIREERLNRKVYQFTKRTGAVTGQNPYALHGFADDYDVNA